MLTHLQVPPTPPSRVVILGGGGFVARAVCRALDATGVPVLSLNRAMLDLLDPDARTRLATILLPTDAVVMAAGHAPCRNNQELVANLAMMQTVCAAVGQTPVAHLVYVGSDAVYADEPHPLTETTPMAPLSLHGVMHLARELMLAELPASVTVASVRPTLIYGAEDPHNGYGPNRFRRLAARGEDIVLFGKGEERRDHILVGDVAEIIRLVLVHRSRGTINAATGTVISFRDIADLVVELTGPASIKETPRTGSMPHGGYRPFDVSALRAAFPGFRPKTAAEGLREIQAAGNGDA